MGAGPGVRGTQARGGTGAGYRAPSGPDRWPPLVAVVGAVLLFVWMGGNEYRADLLVLTCSYALIALGIYVPFIMAHSLSIAYGVYAAIGAYSVALVSQQTGLPLWIGWIFGAVFAALVAIPLSLATRRLAGFFLAAVTLLFSEAVESWLASTSTLGGASGIGDLREVAVFGWVPGRTAQVAFAMILVIVVATALERLRRSPWGLVVRFMREHPLPVSASGVRTEVLVTVSLALGAAIASLGGSLFTTAVGSVTPGTWTLDVVFLVLFIPLLGGQRTVWGSVLGAVVVVQLTLNVSFGQAASGQLIVAFAVLIVMLAAPGGMTAYLETGRSALARLLPTKTRTRGAHDAPKS